MAKRALTPILLPANAAAAMQAVPKQQLDTGLAAKSDIGHAHAISDVTNLQTTLNGKTAETTRSASTMGVVIHGATAGAARPTGYACITWIGSVAPTNAVAGDIWYEA